MKSEVETKVVTDLKKEKCYSSKLKTIFIYYFQI